ncbi:MAG TPA: protein kinase, partial [Labilithrix sp.]|nr:protein kinase [Labilithrix sp.]
GGMGAVYQVSHVHTDERLALKVLHPQVLRDGLAVERFRREARAPARITSEHVARVTDADTAADLDGAPFYVMELLVGRDLERIIADEGSLPAPLVVEYLRQMARALDKAHAIGIVHRDLKPENLFLTHREDGSPCIKLLDFGIARLAEHDGPGPLVTQGGFVFGTPNYMAPEQAIGDSDQISPATDIWPMGLIAFKLLVGHEFFTGKTSAQLYAQILAEPLATPTARGSSFGPAFDAWFARCVARSIPDRFRSAGEAVRDLAAALGVHLSERQLSSADLSGALRFSQPDIGRSSQPNIGLGQTALGIGGSPSLASAVGVTAGPLAANAAVAPGGGTVLPTTLPAGLPPPTSRRVVLAAGVGVVALVAVVGLVFVLRSSAPPVSRGLVAGQSPSEASSSVAAVDIAPPPAQPSSAGSAPLAPIIAASATPTGTHVHGADSKSRPSTNKATAVNEGSESLTRAQKKRLESLERLCSQGTYTAAECQSKRQAIIHGGT